MPSRMPAVSTLLPTPKMLCMIGTMTTSPKNPYTMEGIPASREIAGFRILYSFCGQNLAIKTEHSSPMGTPTRIAIPVA